MERIEITLPTKAKTKKMSDMERGEVCYLASKVCYILRLGVDDDSVFLMLRNDEDCDHFDYRASEHNTVRELGNDESVTIRFS